MNKLPLNAVFGCVLLASCAIQPVPGTGADDDNVLEVFERLCVTAGLQRNKKVREIDGIYVDTSPRNCHHCEVLLRGQGYQFVEFEISDKTLTQNDYLSSSVYGPGLYRMTLRPPFHSDCRAFYHNMDLSNLSAVEARHRLYGGKCIATTKINQVTTPYVFSVKSIKNKKYSEITEDTVSFYNSKTGFVYGQFKNYVYTPNTRKIDFFTQRVKGERHCLPVVPLGAFEFFAPSKK